MKQNNFFHYTALSACIAMIAVCFIPWVHYNSINETFTGFYVNKFPTGVYYGRPGILISIFTGIIFLMNIWNNANAKKANLFISALLFAYCIRTYILFTGSLFDAEVVKMAGIYLIIVLSLLLLVCSIFPKRTN